MSYLSIEESEITTELIFQTFILSEIIKKANMGYGYEQIFLVGQQGTGKTTYAVQSGLQILVYLYLENNSKKQTLEYAQKQVWEDVDQLLHFNPEKRLTDNKPSFYDQFDKALDTGIKIPYVIFDDAGLHFSKYIWSYGDKKARMKVAMVNGIFNLIREGCSGSAFTSPDDDIFVELRKKSWISGEPSQPEGTGWEYNKRAVKLYRKKIRAWDMGTYSKTLGIDNISLWMPEKFRESYLIRKRAEARFTLNELRKISSEIEAEAEKKLLSNEVKKLVNHREVIDISVLDKNRYNKITLEELSTALAISTRSINKIKAKHNSYIESLGCCPDCTAIGGEFKEMSLIDSKEVNIEGGDSEDEF